MSGDDKLTTTIVKAKRIVARDDRDLDAMRQFLYLAPAVMFLKDYATENGAGRYVFVSREWERMYGVRKDSIIGQTDYETFPRTEADRRRLDDVHTLEFGRATTVVDSIGTRYSNFKPIRLALLPLRIGGEDRFTYIAGLMLNQEMRQE